MGLRPIPLVWTRSGPPTGGGGRRGEPKATDGARYLATSLQRKKSIHRAKPAPHAKGVAHRWTGMEWERIRKHQPSAASAVGTPGGPSGPPGGGGRGVWHMKMDRS